MPPGQTIFDIFATAIAAMHKLLATQQKNTCDIMALTIGAT
jgi:hypothetical protein